MILLLSLIALPAMASVLMACSGSERGGALRLALVLSLATVACGIAAVLSGPLHWSVPWFTLPATEAPVRFALQLDGLSSWLVLLVTLLGPVAVLGSWSRQEPGALRTFAVAAFALQACMIGAFLAADIVLFFFFFEAMLIPMVAAIGLFGDPTTRLRASLQFFIYTMLGSVPMLIAIWYLLAATGTAEIAALPLAIASIDPDARSWCFWAFALAFAVKTPLMPFHSWQAPVYAAAPTGAAVLLAGAMAKLGTYGFLRLVLPFFPDDSLANAGIFILAASVGVIAGALMALVQQDLKRLLAYSSLSHLGLIVVGIFSFQATAMSGAVVQMFAHGLAVAALFLLIGVLESRRGSRGVDDFGGLAARAPLFAVLLITAGLAAVALPGMAGFVGEFLILLGSFEGLRASFGEAGIWITVTVGLSLILGAGYVLRALQKIAYGPARCDEDFHDLEPSEAWSIAPLLAASIFFGLYATPITDSAASAVAPIAASIDAAREPQPVLGARELQSDSSYEEPR